MPIHFSPEIAKTLFSLSLTILIAVVVDNILRTFIKVPKHFETRRAQTYATILQNLVAVIVYAVAFYAILIQLKVNITPLLASAGIIGVAIGLGARTLIEDLISGLFLLSQDSIAVGDHIKIDDAEGTIEKINFRTLTIKSGTGAIYIIPNGQIKKVTNFSRHKSTYGIEIPMKADQPIETILKAGQNALNLLEKEKDLAELLLPGSKVVGIEDFQTEGHMIFKVVLVSEYENRISLGRRFRYLLKKEFEKHKIYIGK